MQPAALLSFVLALTPAPASEAPGVIVVSVEPGFAAAEGGVQPGDVLLGWRLEPRREGAASASGRFTSPFDSTLVERDQAPRGAIELTVVRQGMELSRVLPVGNWRIRTRYPLGESDLAAWRSGLRSLEEGAIEQGAAMLRGLANAARAAGDPRRAAWFLVEAARVVEDAARAETRDALWREAIEAARDTGDLMLEADLREGAAFAMGRSRLDEWQQAFSAALALREQAAPNSLAVAASLNNLGVVARRRGDLGEAERLYRRSLALRERLAPDSLAVVGSLGNLAVIARRREQLENAEDLLLRSADILERIGADDQSRALLLHNLGSVAYSRGAKERAGEYWRRALELRERFDPEGPDVAGLLNNLAVLAEEQGELDEAERYQRRCLAIFAKSSPEGLGVARSMYNLGAIQQARGDLAAAEASYREAIRIRQALAPGSTAGRDSLRALGTVLLAAGRKEEALEALEQAVAAIEMGSRRLGGSAEVRGTYRSRHAGYYWDLFELLLELGRNEEAFAVAERWRAQGLLAMLTEYEGSFQDLLPVPSGTAEKLEAEGDRILAELSRLSVSADAESIEGLRAELREVRRRQDREWERLRQAFPRGTDPRPLDLAATRELLEPGTLLLSYFLGEERAYVLAVDASEGLSIHRIEASEAWVRENVEELREAIARGADPGPAAQRLSGVLLAPVGAAIERARRLVIVPDGPLRVLPFAVLPLGEGERRRLLVEVAPYSVVPSATVLAQLRRSERGELARGRVVGFGAPRRVSGLPDGVEATADDATRLRLDLAPLPASRTELEGLQEVFGDEATVWMGGEATEERVVGLSGRYRVVHFATHALVGEEAPLESGLVLSAREGGTTEAENGLLQAWEILRQLRFEADLVTLSACSTALGEEITGEGIVGLTRAFHIAGARSVLASLWRVADRSTALLMRRFYTHLASGLAKDEALRAAQLALMVGSPATETGAERALAGLVPAADPTSAPRYTPFHWAAFQLYGDGN